MKLPVKSDPGVTAISINPDLPSPVLNAIISSLISLAILLVGWERGFEVAGSTSLPSNFKLFNNVFTAWLLGSLALLNCDIEKALANLINFVALGEPAGHFEILDL